MASGDYQIDASVDDGEVWPGGPPSWSCTTWFMELASDIYGWWHWNNILIPRNSTIQVARMQFRAWTSESDACDLRIEGCDEDDSAALISLPDYNSRPKTALVDWNNVENWTMPNWYWTADFSSIVETIVGRAGWVSGNALQVIVKGLVPAATARRTPTAWDGGDNYGFPEWAGKLHLEWMDGDGGSSQQRRSRHALLSRDHLVAAA